MSSYETFIRFFTRCSEELREKKKGKEKNWKFMGLLGAIFVELKRRQAEEKVLVCLLGTILFSSFCLKKKILGRGNNEVSFNELKNLPKMK